LRPETSVPGFRDAEAISRTVVIFVPRNLERVYDVETALRALAVLVETMPEVRMAVAGSGPEENPLRLLASTLGVERRVEFTGRLGTEQMADRYRSASVVLNPSLVDNAPVSLLEALASGVPVVTTDVGGIPFVVENGRTALLVPPGDPASMAAAVRRVLSEPGLARTLRSEGLADVTRHSWSHVRELLGGIYVAARTHPRTGEGRASSQ
jgi:glycosyltransferase involved in cell wall biosynthesis